MELLIHRWRGPPSLTREGLVTAHRSFCAPNAVCGKRLDGRTVFTPTGVCKAIETDRRGRRSLQSLCESIVTDRRGRRSLQGEIKLPYENHPLTGGLDLAVRFEVGGASLSIQMPSKSDAPENKYYKNFKNHCKIKKTVL